MKLCAASSRSSRRSARKRRAVYGRAAAPGKPPDDRVCERTAVPCAHGHGRRFAMKRQTSDEGWLTRERVLAVFLIAITIGVIYLCYLLIVPFVPAITWAVALAVVAYPLHEKLLRRFDHRSLAAGLTVMAVTLTLVVPIALVVRQIGAEAMASVEALDKEVDSGRWLKAIERNPQLAPALKWIQREVNVREQAEKLSEDVLGYAKALVSGSFYVVAGWLVTLFLLFYFFRDREKMLRTLRGLVPLAHDETNQMMRRVRETVYAVVYGTLAVALLQGILGGLMFWILGLPAPLLWGAIMAVLAILPILGAAIIWIPAAVFLALEGSWEKAIVLTAWGGIVVALIDNLLYPVLVKGKLRLHTVPVFIAVLGGLTVFGVAGVVLGPVVLAVAVVLIEIWRDRMAHGQAAENGIDK